MSFDEVCVIDQIWKRIEEVAEQNNGFIRTSQVEELGISRPIDDFIKNEENNRCVRCIESSCFKKLKYQSGLFDIYFCCNCGSDSPCLMFNIKPGSCKLLL